MTATRFTPGTAFRTAVESPCKSITEPDEDGNFIGIDSDGVEVQFNITQVTGLIDPAAPVDDYNTLTSSYRITLTVGSTSQWPNARRETPAIDRDDLWMRAAEMTTVGDPNDVTGVKSGVRAQCTCGGDASHIGRMDCVVKVQRELIEVAEKAERDARLLLTIRTVRAACLNRWGGVSISTVDGSWFDDSGKLVPETSVVATVIVDGGLGVEPKLEDEAWRMAVALGVKLQQDSVLATVEPIRARFVTIARR